MLWRSRSSVRCFPFSGFKNQTAARASVALGKGMACYGHAVAAVANATPLSANSTRGFDLVFSAIQDDEAAMPLADPVHD